MAEKEPDPCCCSFHPCCCADMQTPQPYAKRSRRSAVRQMSNWIDNTGNTAFNFNTTGTRAEVTLIGQNNTSSGRLGDTITLKSIQLKAFIVMAPLATASAAPVSTYCSLWLIYDRDPTGGVIPTIATMFTNVSSSNMLLPNEDGSRRFLTVRRWDFVLHSGGFNMAFDQRAFSIDEYIPTTLPTRYLPTSTSGSYSQVEKGAWLLVSYGTQASAAVSAVTGTIVARTRWYNKG